MIVLNLIATAAVLFILFGPHSDLTSAGENWTRLSGAILILLAIWLG